MNKRKILSILLILVMIVSLSSCGTTTSQNDGSNDLIVMTQAGDVEGFSEDGVRKFYGIPFAKAPVGDLRFAPPQDMEEWDDILKCTEKKPSALQINDSKDLKYSEDCLYLNIWAPEDGLEKGDLPVLVFIHGGAFAFGSPSMEKYDGTRFAKDGVIQVNISYRLNAMGFAAFDEIEEEYGYVGNMGMLDQIKALEWVQQNIDAFGGDAENVTVCGESAGSMSISNLLLSDDASELFSKAIMQSGTLLTQPIIGPGASGDEYDAKAATKRLMKAVGADSLEELRKTDADAIVSAAAYSLDMTKQTDQYFFPTFDDRLIPEKPYKALMEEDINQVDILTGYNRDEGTLFIPEGVSEKEYEEYMKLGFGTYAEKAMDQYPVDSEHSPTDRLREVVKACFAVGSRAFGDAFSENGHDVFLYEYAYSTEAVEKMGLDAHHGMELEFVFDTLPDYLQDETSQKVKEDIHNRWLNFIVNSDPNKGVEFDIQWPKYKKSDQRILRIDENPTMETFPMNEDYEFMKSVLWE